MTKKKLFNIINKLFETAYLNALLAQLDRASVYGTEG